MPQPLIQAQPPLEFIPPDFNPLVYQVAEWVLPLYLRGSSRVESVEVKHPERLVELYQQFQEGKVRFMLAFRHPSTEDPTSMFQLLSREVPKAAREMGVKLKHPIHAHFIYDRGIPLWAGGYVGWLYSKLGCTPIRRGGLDRTGLRTARDLFANGRFPMSAAPEGATNGHNEIVSPIEPGIAQFGFWCAEDLQKQGRTERVLIVPIGIQYFYTNPPWRSLEKLLSALETESGIEHNFSAMTLQDGLEPTAVQMGILYKRLYNLGEHLLSQMETFYRKFYHQELTGPLSATAKEGGNFSAGALPLEMNQELGDRLRRLLDAALTVAEQFFAITPKGSFTDRCRRLEQAGWDWIFREDLNVEEASPVERGLADRIAEEANLRIWHMRLVETFVSVTGRYVGEKPTVDRFAEMLLLLWDMVMRIKGKPPFPRIKLGLQQAQLTVGEPLSVSDRWPNYQKNRRQTVTSMTQDLQTALEQMIR